MSQTDLVLALETRLINAWPSFEVEVAEGWILRFAEGYSKRANAATPLRPGATLDRALIDHVVASFAARGLDPCFRLTSPSEDSKASSPAVRIESAAKPAWVAAGATAYGGEKANADRLGRIVRLIRQPAGFATLELDGQPAAWGLAVAERGYVGLYDIVVAPDLRGLGLGRRLVSTLMAWGRDRGAARAYLQMRAGNTVAAGLYASLGFTTAYAYSHRVPAAWLRAREKSVATSAPAAISPQASASQSVGSA